MINISLTTLDPANDASKHESSNLSHSLPISKLNADALGDLEQILERNLKKIIRQYASFVNCILRSVLEKNVTPAMLSSYLLNLPAVGDKEKDGQRLTLLSGLRAELEAATTVNTIFNLLSTKYASFLDYDIFESIADEYSIDDTNPKMKYPEYLEAFLKQHKVSEFMKINPLLKDLSNSSKEVTLKLNIESTCSLAKLKDLTKTIANILGISKSALRILDIKDGCVILKLLILTPILDAIFGSNCFTSEQVQQFSSISVLWMECNDFKYEMLSSKEASGMMFSCIGNKYVSSYSILLSSVATRCDKQLFT